MGCGSSRQAQATPPQPPAIPGLKPFPASTAKPPQPAAAETRPIDPPSAQARAEPSLDPDLLLELNFVRLDKRGRPVDAQQEEKGDVEQGLGGAFFELATLEEGDNALAVKPWVGALKAPSSIPAVRNTAPKARLELEYVYGFRCVDSRQNLYYTQNPDEVVYMAGAVGIVLSKSTNTQRFFGAGDNKTVSAHDDDITALAIHPEKDIVATGQLGKNPKICVWQSSDLVMLSHFLQGRDTRAVTTLAFSPDGNLLSAADNHNDHNVRVWDWRKGTLLHVDKGGPDKILDMSWSPRANVFSTVGIKHIFFWQVEPFKKDRGIFGQNPQCDMLVARWLPNGYCLTGGTSGCLYLWPGKSLSKSQQVHAVNAAVHALAVVQDKVLSGGKDNKVVISTTSLQQLKVIPVEACPRALDMLGDTVLCGMRNGSIVELGMETVVFMESHSDGEIWGLTTHPTRPELVLSTCDDNKLKVWDMDQRRCIATGIVERQPGPARKAGFGASTHSPFPPNQQSRAVAVGTNGHVAVAHNDGHVTIRSSVDDLDNVLFQLRDPKEWTEAMSYSPTGEQLAVGSHDNFIYIYDVKSRYKLLFKLRGHSSFITGLDWSVDGHAMHSSCGAYELLFWDVDSGRQVPSGATAYRDEDWASWTTKLGWPVQGIYGGVVDMTHINGVDRSKDKALVAVGNDYGLVEIFNYPNGVGAKSNAYQAHCEHVTNVKWTLDDSRVISAGGYDMCVMQWKRLN